MTGQEQWDLSQALMPALIAARKAILEVYQSGDFGTQEKDDRSPVTEADRCSHDILTGEMRALTPDIPVISEESRGDVGEVRAEQYFWLVDPLDGTKEFIRQSGEFTINVGLIEPGGRPILGLIDVPIVGKTYIGMDRGVFVDAGTGCNPLHPQIRPQHDKMVVALSRSHEGLAQEWLREHQVEVSEIMYGGSALKFCWIAEGRADLYVRLRPTMGWDTAAGQAIVESAHGSLVTMEGQPLRYLPGAHRNPYFVAKSRYA